MQHKTRDEHLFGPGPKRILALDGGGIRGVLTLGYLKYIEDMLRQRHGNDPDFRLSDYFDLIGGTSTGSIASAVIRRNHRGAWGERMTILMRKHHTGWGNKTTLPCEPT